MLDIRKYTAKTFDRGMLFLRGKARQIDKAYRQGKISEGDRVVVTYNASSFLSRTLPSRERFWLSEIETPESNVGIISLAKTKNEVPYIVLHDAETSFRLDDRFDSWGKL